MPGNFQTIGVIKTLFPNAKIIHCNRNPMDTCASIYLNHFREGHEYSFDMSDLGHRYLEYLRIMKHWREIFPSEIFEIYYEELVDNQESISRQMFDYIGLEWDEKCLDFYKTDRAVRTASNQQVRQPMYKSSIEKWKRYEKHLQPLYEVLKDVVNS